MHVGIEIWWFAHFLLLSPVIANSNTRTAKLPLFRANHFNILLYIMKLFSAIIM